MHIYVILKGRVTGSQVIVSNQGKTRFYWPLSYAETSKVRRNYIQENQSPYKCLIPCIQLSHWIGSHIVTLYAPVDNLVGNHIARVVCSWSRRTPSIYYVAGITSSSIAIRYFPIFSSGSVMESSKIIVHHTSNSPSYIELTQRIL